MSKYSTKLNYYRKNANGRYRHRWTFYELNLILDGSKTDRELSDITGHSIQAIQMKRSRYLRRMYSDIEKEMKI